MRGVYWAKMPDYESKNFFNNQRKLPGYLVFRIQSTLQRWRDVQETIKGHMDNAAQVRQWKERKRSVITLTKLACLTIWLTGCAP